MASSKCDATSAASQCDFWLCFFPFFCQIDRSDASWFWFSTWTGTSITPSTIQPWCSLTVKRHSGCGWAQRQSSSMSSSQSGNVVAKLPTSSWVCLIFSFLALTCSGLLLSYNFLRNNSKIQEIQENSFVQNIKLFGKQFVHRYIR